MLPPIRIIPLAPMPRHIQHNLNPHRRLLAIGQIPIPDRIHAQLLVFERRHPPRIHRNQLILLIPMPHEPGRPPFLPFVLSRRNLLPEETKPTIALGVDFDVPRQHEALRDGGLHLGDGARGGFVDVRRAAVAAVHDEGAAVHTALRGGDEVLVEGPSCPGRVDVGVWREDGGEVFPFAGVAGTGVVSSSGN